MSNVITTRFEGDILFVEIDNPPVNATSQALRQGLMGAVDQAKTARVVLLSGAGKTFIAGGDMSEFDYPPAAPDLPDVVTAIEHSPASWVALLHGTVLGGGLEVSLGCHHRIAARGTRFGLPEVNVGIIPGAGGSQRLPRLVGFELALEMATTGKMVSSKTMLEAGGIDQITDDLHSTALALAKNLPAKPTHVSQLPRPVADLALVEETRHTLAKKANGQKAPLYNLEATLWACETDFTEGQKRERQLHLELRGSAQSIALRHAFFAERAAAQPEVIKGVNAENIAQVAIVGGGLMGAGIATSCLLAGIAVHLLETGDSAVNDGLARINTLLDGAQKRGKLSADKRASISLTGSTNYEDSSNADLAIEAVFEDLDVKQQVFAKLAAHMADDAILATNTSYLDPNEIFIAVKNPSRCLGLHFFSPAHIMKLVEIIALETTTPETLATGFAFAKMLRKSPVLSGVCDGFIGNRMLAAYRRAADYLLADGALPKQIDTAMRGFGMPLGPYELQDMTGLQISYANRQRQATTHDPAERYVTLGDTLVEMGRTGQRAGKGWYRYKKGNRTPLADPEVTDLIKAYCNAPKIFSDQQISERLLAALINEGQCILEEGIAANADDIDVVKLLGYGFPRWRGGPMQYGETLPNLRDMVHALAAQSPGSWKLAKKFAGVFA